jgi:hypothetical protein
MLDSEMLHAECGDALVERDISGLIEDMNDDTSRVALPKVYS